MKRLAIALLALSLPASAAPIKVMVLPLDGDAPEAQRQALAAQLASDAQHDGDVTSGTTTYRETAAAAGCNPDDAACATTVLTTLGVDEVVYGSATVDGATTHVKVTRVTRDQHTERSFDITPRDAAGSGSGSATSNGTGSASIGNDATQMQTLFAPPQSEQPAPTTAARRDRTIGIAMVAGGGLAIVIGVALWISEHGVQGQIDGAPDATLGDVQSLVALESSASDQAVAGNVLVIVGAAVAGVGGYFLWRDHEAHVAVAPVDHGAAVTFGGRW